MTKSSFENLTVWQDSISLTNEIYMITRKFPKVETYGIISQLRRASVSVSTNITEGCGRKSLKEFIHFLYISKGSLYEVYTLLLISRNQSFIEIETFNSLVSIINTLIKQLTSLINTLNTKKDLH